PAAGGRLRLPRGPAGRRGVVGGCQSGPAAHLRRGSHDPGSAPPGLRGRPLWAPPAHGLPGASPGRAAVPRPGCPRGPDPRRHRGGPADARRDMKAWMTPPLEMRLFNTLTGRVEPLVPLRPGEIGMYVCGVTVYNRGHIGNFRPFVATDLLRRALRYAGYRVNEIMNVTDVDDRIIEQARAAGRGLTEFTGQYVRAFLEDADRL